ncbi:MAG TPA: TonB-dependent receptor [Thermoanaerobaculia bacterium]|nr:TonB-dependent receptor [Thermoanaerobaculia bacterium]
MTRKAVSSFLFASLGLVLALAPALAQGTGTLEGRISGQEDAGLELVVVQIVELDRTTESGSDGSYRFDDVPAGSYTVVFSNLSGSQTEQRAEVKAGEATRLDVTTDWSPYFAEAITVTSASRRPEKITEAPAAVTVISAEQIDREAAHGQLPKLLEFTPGAEVTQSGIYDFNFNTRGFNSSLNRRVATLIDGRDPSVPFLGAQEWAALSFPLDDIANAELVRGPSAALYGANASSGVLNIVTKAPRDSQGGEVRATVGELSTRNVDLRWATGLGGDWYLKLLGGYHTSGDFSESRRGAAEYSVPCASAAAINCLPQEATGLVIVNDNKIAFGGLRLDRYFGESLLTLEGGYATIEGPLFQTGIGRVQLTDVERPWARVNYNMPHLNLLGYWNNRKAEDQRALASNTPLYLDDTNFQIEAQTNWDFWSGRARVVAGASYGEEEVDSVNPQGRQTLIFEPIDADFTALYAQGDFELASSLKLVVAGRFDDSSLHDSQFSPKGSLVWQVRPNHGLRLSYNEAFQVANYSEFYLQANVAAPANLSAFEPICRQFGVDCGFGSPVPVLALGNKDLEVEETKTIEVGYTGILSQKAFLTVEYYQSENENFITDLVPNVGTVLGRVNPNFGAYAPPSTLPAAAQMLLLNTLRARLPAATFAILSNNVDGRPILAARSYTNFGQVDTEGLDLGLNVFGHGGWRYQLAYSWFDFEIQDPIPGLEQILIPNSPAHKFSVGVTYVGKKLDATLGFRWSDEFRWVVGPFQGQVRDYYTADLGFNYALTPAFKVGASVANVTNNEHWEAFGGDLIGRRALVHMGYTW